MCAVSVLNAESLTLRAQYEVKLALAAVLRAIAGQLGFITLGMFGLARHR